MNKYNSSAIPNIRENFKFSYLTKSPSGIIFRQDDKTNCISIISEDQKAIFELPQEDAELLALWILNNKLNG